MTKPKLVSKLKKRSNWWNKAKKIRNEADTKWQQVGVLKGKMCEICLRESAVCCHHIINKSLSNRLRYELINGIRVCQGCHNKIHSTADPAIFRRIEEVVGKERMAELERLRREEVKVNEEFYQTNLEKLEKCLTTNSNSQVSDRWF